MKISIDKQNKLTDSSQKNSLNFQSVRTNIRDNWGELSVDEAAQLITNGCSWSPTHFIRGFDSASFNEAQTIGLDIDDIESPTPQQATQLINRWFNADPAIIYHTLSSNPTNNKYRIILNLDQPIKAYGYYTQICRAFVSQLKTDSACTDPARIFYGTTPDKLISTSDDLINTDELIKWSELYGKKEITKERTRTNRESVEGEGFEWIRGLSNYDRVCVQNLNRELHSRLIDLWQGSGYQSLFKAANSYAIKLPVELTEDQFLDVVLFIFDKAVEANPEWNNCNHNPEKIASEAFQYARKYAV